MPTPQQRIRLLLRPAMLTGATWALDGLGRAYNMPPLGAELLTNTEFTSNTTGWGVNNAATLTRRDFASSPNIAPTGGADNWGLEVASGGNATGNGSAGSWATTGRWYSISARCYAPSSNTGTNSAMLATGATTGTNTTVSAENAWLLISYIARATSTSATINLRINSGTAGDVAYFDAPSIKMITLPTTLATVTGSANNLNAAAKIHAITTGTQAGVGALIDSASNPQNFLIAYHNGTSVLLDKCVAGTYTNLITTTVAFSSGAQIEIRRPSGNTFQLWYNGSQRGTDQTVSDAGIIDNTRYGLFSTHSGNLFTEFSLGGVVIPFTLPGA